MSKLSKFFRELGKNDPPRPKWRDEKMMFRMFSFPFGIMVSGVFWENHRQYSWAEVAMFITVAFMWGNICGVWQGRETEQLFPSDYRWDRETKSWIKK